MCLLIPILTDLKVFGVRDPEKNLLIQNFFYNRVLAWRFRKEEIGSILYMF